MLPIVNSKNWLKNTGIAHSETHKPKQILLILFWTKIHNLFILLRSNHYRGSTAAVQTVASSKFEWLGIVLDKVPGIV